ncbi:S-layer homology domain-containing protein [Oscillospiraceae bacterium CM]|nr:S-layer homology domain-containing protein [Oscillospiraceae bacterium CM]
MKRYIKAAATAALLALLVSIASNVMAVSTVQYLGTYRKDTENMRSAEAVFSQQAYPESTDYTVGDYESFIETAAEQFVARDTDFTIAYINVSFSTFTAIVPDQIWDDIFSADLPETTSDLDYLSSNMVGYMYMSRTWSNGTAAYKFTQSYLTTQQQEDYVDAAVETILEQLDIGESSQYEKIKAVHDYIKQQVDYDYTLEKYSAYDGLYSKRTVCNGYALLLYKMLLEAGVPVRIITGQARNSSDGHAWNIAQIGKYWYNIDVTWDDTGRTSAYFLKNDAAFSDHDRDPEYDTAAFYAEYPMSPVNFNSSRDVTLVASITFPSSEGVYTVGDTFTLTPTISPADATNKTLRWYSIGSYGSVVDSAGHVTVDRAGTVYVVAEATDGSGVAAMYQITAYDNAAVSPWAQADVAALAARGVVPEALASSYQSSITRAEFTALMVNIYEYAAGDYTAPTETPFTDISSSPYAAEIAKGYALGIVSGQSPTTFGPNGTLTREQCAKIIGATVAAVTSVPVSSSSPLPYQDASRISAWALLYVRYAYENGLMTGTGTNFEPQGLLSREQAMTIAERMIEKYAW